MIEPNIYCKVSGMVMRCISMCDRQPVVIEVGCADGQGVMRYAGFTSRTIAIDAMLPGRPDIVNVEDGDLLVGLGQSVAPMTRQNAVASQDRKSLENFARRNSEFPVALIIGLSQDLETLAEVEKQLRGGLADVVVIDGVHHPEGAVWADITLYERFLRPGGFMVLDDLYETDIVNCWNRLVSERGYTVIDRWGVNTPTILQECGALRRPL